MLVLFLGDRATGEFLSIRSKVSTILDGHYFTCMFDIDRPDFCISNDKAIQAAYRAIRDNHSKDIHRCYQYNFLPP